MCMCLDWLATSQHYVLHCNKANSTIAQAHPHMLQHLFSIYDHGSRTSIIQTVDLTVLLKYFDSSVCSIRVFDRNLNANFMTGFYHRYTELYNGIGNGSNSHDISVQTSQCDLISCKTTVFRLRKRQSPQIYVQFISSNSSTSAGSDLSTLNATNQLISVLHGDTNFWANEQPLVGN